MTYSTCDNCKHSGICKYKTMCQELERNTEGGHIEIFRLKVVCCYKESVISYKIP